MTDRVVRDLGIEGLGHATPIGQGGFAVVYRAFQKQLGRDVAVKVLMAVSTDQHAHRRYEQERLAMGTLSSHPNIVSVFDAGTTPEGRPFLIMEYHADGSFQDRLDAGHLVPWEDACSVGIKLAGALESAHRAGVLHRDVKPANVLLSSFREPLLSDFGIARIMGAVTTGTGVFIGSPPYAAPEVVAGEPANPASDVYSLGATMFALIKGRPAFLASDTDPPLAVMHRAANEPVPDLRAEGVPDPVAGAIEGAMEKDPAQRPQSAEAFGRIVERALDALGLPPTRMELVAAPDLEPESGATTVSAQRPARATSVTAGAPTRRHNAAGWWSGPRIAAAALLLVASAVAGVSLGLLMRDTGDRAALTVAPIAAPTTAPTTAPSATPTTAPSATPTTAPTATPTTAPTATPTTTPTATPTTTPTATPTTTPTTTPTSTVVATRPDLGDLPPEPECAGLLEDLSGLAPTQSDVIARTFACTDLTGAEFLDLDLSGQDFSGANLTSADLHRSDFRAANMSWSNLTDSHWNRCCVDTDFTNATFAGAILRDAGIDDANLTGADLRLADLSEASLGQVNATGADLRAADLTGANGSRGNFRGALFVGARMTDGTFSGAAMVRADLSDVVAVGTTRFVDADLTEAVLEGADFTGAVLYGADFSGAQLSGIQLRNAETFQTIFTGATIRDAGFDNTDLQQALFTGADLTGSDLTTARRLDEVIWQDTICPDGTNSNDVGGTCEGHLRP